MSLKHLLPLETEEEKLIAAFAHWGDRGPLKTSPHL